MVRSEIRERRRLVAELRGENPKMKVAELASRLGTSKSTIQRDLNAIARARPVELVQVAPSEALATVISALHASFLAALQDGDRTGMLAVASELRQAVKLSAEQGPSGAERDAPALEMIGKLLERQAA